MNGASGPEDARFFVESSMEAIEYLPFLDGTVAVFSKPAPGKETPNQDAAAIIPYDADSGILAVADGLGGARGGSQASATTVYEMCASLEHASKEKGNLRGAILDGMENANREVCALAIGAGSTLAVVEFRKGAMRPYHIGDSEIFVVGRRGKIKLQTVSHSPMGYAVESGFIGEREALSHEDRHLVFNVIGVPDMRIEVGGSVELAPLDTVLIACDGLFDNLTSEEIALLLCQPELAKAAESLVKACQERMLHAREGEPHKPDDLTILIWRREEES